MHGTIQRRQNNFGLAINYHFPIELGVIQFTKFKILSLVVSTRTRVNNIVKLETVNNTVSSLYVTH
jgi:hypothetical protein